MPAQSRKRIVFGEDGEVPAVPVGDGEMDDGLEGLYSGTEDGADSEEETAGLSKEEIAARRRRRHALQGRQRQLEALRDREAQLSAALREVEEQRARMNGTVGGVNKHGVKFKARQRNR